MHAGGGGQGTDLREGAVVRGAPQLPRLALRVRRAREHLVERVVRALARADGRHADLWVGGGRAAG